MLFLIFSTTIGENSVTQWDLQIQNACTSLNDVLEKIVERHPFIFDSAS